MRWKRMSESDKIVFVKSRPHFSFLFYNSQLKQWDKRHSFHNFEYRCADVMLYPVVETFLV